ncbi:P-loop containing nucleoside triphosphate hydrolase protein [Dendrothele bispora CBS 962.96]|uniref:P-loop containing nucleoside triphosphate hydrolase protein n=1 Tax=Dendrothele bispora (strain CBS 962.96) TaxID=1314807 RepID=A0A4V4HHV1_DENBC|nr:P-loop containing nucleoside triphosphate hydrolase protein [Dendrothele bispora CBS 962.96]
MYTIDSNHSQLSQPVDSSPAGFDRPVHPTQISVTRQASETLCSLYNIPSLPDFQEKAGQNVLLGKDTFLDIPTGGGKTLAFYYALFYHWKPGITEQHAQKIVLIIGPLSGLLQAQADTLTMRGVPAIALTGNNKDLDKDLKDFGNGRFRVGFVGPEMALSKDFHANVLESEVFQESCIVLVVDEAHNISEWGTDDFRPDFARIQALLGRLPSNLPTLVASATVPPEIIEDIKDKLGTMRKDTAMIAVSNEKPNVSLSVHIMQHPQDTFADLLPLFPSEASGPLDFPQTLIYVNGTHFEFYHRYVTEDCKTFIEKGLYDGSLRAVPATDALGMGLDFRGIKRVVLWNEPQVGKAILFVTKAAVSRSLAEFDMTSYEDKLDLGKDMIEPKWKDQEIEVEEEETITAPIEVGDENKGVAIIVPVTRKTDGNAVKPKRIKRKKIRTKIGAHNRWFLLWFIVTTSCRHIPWNTFHKNKQKMKSPYPSLPGVRCCDNCHPEKFTVPTVQLFDPGRVRLPGRAQKSSEELHCAVQEKLTTLREAIIDCRYPNQYIITGKAILQDDVIQALAERARLITSVDSIKEHVRWHWANLYGQEVVDAIGEVLKKYPDVKRLAQEAQEQERAEKAMLVMKKKEFWDRLRQVSDICFEAVESLMHPGGTIQVCRMFKWLP